MNTYKIINITHLLGKREQHYNSDVVFDYIDDFVKKSITIKPKEFIYLVSSKIPISLQRLRIKNHVAIIDVSGNELELIKSNNNSVLIENLENTKNDESLNKTKNKTRKNEKKNDDSEIN